MSSSQDILEQGMEAFTEAMEEMGFPVSSDIEYGVRKWFEFSHGWEGRRVVGFAGLRDVAVKLLADSFAFQLALEPGSCDAAIDIGSGNGWPGLALKLSQAPLNLTLLDSRQGACQFMEGYVRFASLTGVTAVCQRGEEACGQAMFRERFAAVTSRAMGDPAVVAEIASGFLDIGGAGVLWLGPEQENRLLRRGEIPELGLRLETVKRYDLPEGTGKRVLGMYRKVSPCSRLFPRRVPAIKRKPLL